MQSANEELQSTNEELESSREEFQSLNEELHTINAELQSKVEELSAAQDDMRNLLNGTQMATILVDNDQRIRRFTKEATTIINLIESDIGRPLRHVVTNLAYENMIADLSEVLNTRSPKAVEVRTTNEQWYNMRILPYCTMDNRIDGAVLTFAAIGDQKKVQATLNESRHAMEQALELVRHAFDMNPEPIAVLDSQGRMVIANTQLSKLLGVAQNKVNDMDFLSVQPGTFRAIDLKSELKTALKKGKDFTTRPVEVKLPDSSQSFAIHGRIIKSRDDNPYRILLHFVKTPPKE